MLDITTVAGNVSHWADLGLKLPAGLTKYSDLLEELKWSAQKPTPVIDVDKLNTKNLAATIETISAELAAAEHHDDAVLRTRRELARAIVREAGVFVPDALEQLRPRFDTEVARYTEAVSKLPTELTSDSLVKAGPDALAAFGVASEAAGFIAAVDHWLASLNNLPATAGFQQEPVLRVTAPETMADLRKLEKAGNATKVDALVTQVGKVYLAAAQNGIKFQMNIPREAAQIRAGIDQAEAAAAAKRKGF
ncbi:hypothetical protein [Rhodococcus opacus]|uniref:hypothetical protein n=1 Tax=Rhodococcus opacus TaxID=37919 RepID=UPI002948F1E4|nr:hypothetical protein [Rhodococcus opacus]MDV6246881.1 hypothetical protein [Rhodococcus opacus]